MLKKTALKRKSGLKSKIGFVSKKTTKKEIAEYRKTPKKGWKPPSWIKSIPQGSHGSTSIQKKYWKVISDLVRIKDFYMFGGYCFGCQQNKINHWKDGQCAHFKSWGASNSYAKFEIRNLLMTCANCNNNENGMIGYRIGEQLQKMYGKKNNEYIEEQNNNYRGVKMEDMVLVEAIELLLPNFEKLTEQPDWYHKVLAKMLVVKLS